VAEVVKFGAMMKLVDDIVIIGTFMESVYGIAAEPAFVMSIAETIATVPPFHRSEVRMGVNIEHGNGLLLLSDPLDDSVTIIVAASDHYGDFAMADDFLDGGGDYLIDLGRHIA